jgi:hypothetical protein
MSKERARMSRLRAASFLFAALAVAESGLVGIPASAQSSSPWWEAPVPSPYSTGLDIRMEEFRKERTVLTAQARDSISVADKDIDALEAVVESHGELERAQYVHMADGVSVLKRRMEADVDKMGRVGLNDWDDLSPLVRRDLADLNDELRRVSKVTHIAAPGGSS